MGEENNEEITVQYIGDDEPHTLQSLSELARATISIDAPFVSYNLFGSNYQLSEPTPYEPQPIYCDEYDYSGNLIGRRSIIDTSWLRKRDKKEQNLREFREITKALEKSYNNY